MINDKIELNFEIILRKNKRKVKFECTTNKYNTVSTDICIDDKPMDISPDDLLREQLDDFGFNNEEIETFVLLKNHKTTDVKHLIIELDRYIYDGLKNQARKYALEYLTQNKPIKEQNAIISLLNTNLPNQIPFDVYNKNEHNVKQLYTIMHIRDNDKFMLQFIIRLITKYKKYVIKIKSFSLNIKNTANTSLYIVTKPTSKAKELKLRLHELIPIITKNTEITSNNIPLHMLDVDTANEEYRTIKFNHLFKNIDASEYLSNPASHSANYYIHKDNIIIPEYKHIMTDETKQKINHMLAKATTEKISTGQNPLSNEDMQYVSQKEYMFTNKKTEDGYQSIFVSYTQNNAYDKELYSDDNITSNNTVIKILTAVSNIL